MNPSDDRVETIFHAALELSGSGEREAFIGAECRGDAAIEERVRRLLEVHQDATALLAESPQSSPIVRELAPRPKPEQAGERIGPYKLLQQIGEGGFGVVWMAEQEQPVRRRVALKIIKLGMDTKDVVARFEQERQALAMMDHPNIAKVFDAGATDKGRPFFVMELVKGVPITKYCDQVSLPTADRLRLFIAVCHAVQHAHQKGIIHRDLKPSNILVTLHDGVPVPKVIDFGIAKATQQRLTDKTLFTKFAEMIGTPLYMSPEQAEMSGLDIDTRTDIYALGVLLYELLTGRTPFDPAELMQRGLDEIRRAIREQEPPRPSTALSTMAADAMTAVAQHRQSDSAKLLGLLRGDLDWIVMKAIEKDRTRRYDTANAFAEDIQRHLASEPVVACPPSAAYLLRKLVRRHRRVFAAVSAVVLALIAGIAVSSWQAVRATQAEKKTAAERDAKELARKDAEDIAKFLGEVFQSPDPARDGRTITVAETLDKAARKLETELATQPAQRAKLQATLGLTYHSLGLYREAISLQEKARDYYLASSGLEHPDTLNVMNKLGNSYSDAGRRDEALKLREDVLSLRRKVLGPEDPDTLWTMHNLTISYYHVGRKDEALKLREEVLPLRRKVLGPEHRDTLTAMQNLAESYADAGRRDEALKLREEVLARCRKANHRDTLWALHNLAESYAAAGRRDEAIKLCEELLALRLKLLGPEHSNTLWTMENLAESYSDAGRPDAAIKLREESLALIRKLNGPEHSDTLDLMAQLAFTYDNANRRNEALKLREELLTLRRKVLGPDNPDTLYAMHALAISYCKAGRRDEALKLQEEVLPLRR